MLLISTGGLPGDPADAPNCAFSDLAFASSDDCQLLNIGSSFASFNEMPLPLAMTLSCSKASSDVPCAIAISSSLDIGRSLLTLVFLVGFLALSAIAFHFAVSAFCFSSWSFWSEPCSSVLSFSS